MSIRILVAGGCHVVGYPIGEYHSFVHSLTECLDNMGVGAEAKAIAYLPVHHVPRMVEAIRRERPDLIVLQLGNYETTVTFRQYLRRKLGLKKEKASSAQCQLSPDAAFRPTWSWKAKCFAKLCADTLLLHDLLDMTALDASFAHLFDAIRGASPGEVIVLGPLPCADPLYMRYRDRLAVVMERLAQTRGFLFVPSPLGVENVKQYFVDATHLNKHGQERLGNTVAAAISQVCRNAPPHLALR